MSKKTTSQDLKTIERRPLMLNDISVNQRQDGYVNATAMCKAGQKQFNDFFRLDRTHLFLQALSKSTGIPVDLLVQVVKTGANENKGTYVHPKVAISLAMWISPDFEVSVTDWIMTGIIETTKREHNHVLQAYT